MPNDNEFVPLQTREDVPAIALAGLLATPKTLPAMLFYDDEGCRLFYEITRLPEYYLTRTETALLRSIAAAAVPDEFKDAILIEFGGSDETKARICSTAPKIHSTLTCRSMWRRRQCTRCNHVWHGLHPDLTVVPIVADFMQPLLYRRLARRAWGSFPARQSAILTLRPRLAFLASARVSLGAGSWFLLGADLRKSPKVLLPAYNDASGVTAAFNLNLLRRLNREAGADFDLNAFRHEAVWNDADSRIEMHLISTRYQTAHIRGRSIEFREAESIHTENSYKHTPEKLMSIAHDAGWETWKVWKDHAGLFGVILLHAQ